MKRCICILFSCSLLALFLAGTLGTGCGHPKRLPAPTLPAITDTAWNAHWISSRVEAVSDRRGYFGTYQQSSEKNPGDTAALWFQTTLDLPETVDSARVRITGLGYYELYINGTKVGDHVLDPVFSDYQRSVYYQEYGIDSLLRAGANEIRILLGNGFYNSPSQDLFMMDQAHWKTPPKLLFRLDAATATDTYRLVSDSTWRWSPSRIVYNSIRGGETIDARYQPIDWQVVAVVDGPLGVLRPQTMPPLRVTRSLRPDSIWSVSKRIHVVDFGENLTGWVRLELSDCPRDSLVRIYFNEVLNPDGSLKLRHSSGHTRGRFQEGRFICDGSAGVFEPRFSYHGFRYVQIEGLERSPRPEEIRAKAVHTDLPSRGSFICANESLNELQSAVRRTLLNSIHSMPGEEPTREKMGWTLDAGLVTMESYLYNFGAESSYRKYLQDLIDGQEPSGHVPPIVPTNGWGFLQPDGNPIQYDDPWWGGTLFFVAETLYEWTADTAVIRQAYVPMQRYLDFIGSTADDRLLVHWSLGDWLDLTHGSRGWGPGLTPVVQTSTAAYYWMADALARHARLLGHTADAERYAGLADQIRHNLNAAFLDTKTGWYAASSQTAQALPLYLGLVPDRYRNQVEDRLLEAIRYNDYHTNVGFLGVQPLLKYLSENGHIDLAYRLVNQEESPGWLHMVRDGHRSTLGENLNARGYGTGHHPFGAVIGHWFYQYLAGIQVGENPGWEQFVLAPGVVAELPWAEARFTSPYGEIRSRWEWEGERVVYRFSVPPETRARVELRGNPAIVPQILMGAANSAPIWMVDRWILMLGAGAYKISGQ